MRLGLVLQPSGALAAVVAAQKRRDIAKIRVSLLREATTHAQRLLQVTRCVTQLCGC